MREAKPPPGLLSQEWKGDAEDSPDGFTGARQKVTSKNRSAERTLKGAADGDKVKQF